MIRFILAISFSIICPLFTLHANERPVVLTTFSILQNITSQLAPSNIEVRTLVTHGEDLHSYKTSAQDVTKLNGAQLVLTWGLGLDEVIFNLAKKSNNTSKTFKVTDNTSTLKAQHKNHIKLKTEKTHSHTHEPFHHDTSKPDPHVWQSPKRMVSVVENISKILIRQFPSEKSEIESLTKSYVTKLQKINQTYKKIFSNIPLERKRIITSHQAFDYLGQDMGIEIFSVAGLDSEVSPSPKNVQALVKLIQDNKIHALFAEHGSNSRVLQRVSEETKVSIVGSLYSDALPLPPGPQSYLEFIEYNLKTISTTLIKAQP